MIGKDSLVVLANLIPIMAEKMEEPILHVRGWINGRITITVAILYSRMVCGDRLPSPLQGYQLVIGFGSGIGARNHAR